MKLFQLYLVAVSHNNFTTMRFNDHFIFPVVKYFAATIFAATNALAGTFGSTDFDSNTAWLTTAFLGSTGIDNGDNLRI
jgi:hypothetical protein